VQPVATGDGMAMIVVLALLAIMLDVTKRK
jgi:hypothetical protein